MASKGVSKQESELQAVIISDNFDVPEFTLQTSWALLPFAGARLIDYTIEFFLQTPVDEVIIFSVVQSKRVEEYIRKRWISSGLASFRITFMSSETCRSMGDALRDIDSKAIIKSDFLLTQAGFVSNDNLSRALSVHRSRRVKDKNAVLTLIYSDSSVNHPARCRDLDAFLLLDTITSRLLHYQQFTGTDHQFEYPLELLTLQDEVSTHFDLLDCNMAICSAQIPPLFSDNFDFQTRRNLIREILTNEEILGYRVFVHIVEDKLAAFVGDLNSYLAISENILERWCFPIVPDMMNGDDATAVPFSWRWPNVYIADNVKSIAKTARIGRNVLIGRNCQISENCELINVTMGENCTIGPNAVLKNCILWDNVTVEAGCVIENSILCNGTRIGSKSTVSGRCILGNNVSLPSEMCLPVGIILCKNSAPADSSVRSEVANYAPNCFRWRLAEPNNDGSTEIWPVFIRLDFAGEAEGGAAGKSSEESGSEKSDAEQGDGEASVNNAEDELEDDYDIFYQEVLESLQRGFAKQISCDNLIMEINSSKHAYNVPVAELQRRVMAAILATPLDQDRIKVETGADLVKAYKEVLSHFLPLIHNYFKPKNHASTSISTTQSNCLDSIREFALGNLRFLPALSQVLYFLYDKDVFEEDSLLPWCKELEEPMKSQVRPFVQWLEEAEEESSSSE